MNAGKAQSCFIDSNIWLYRFIVNPNDPHAIPKQKIATFSLILLPWAQIPRYNLPGVASLVSLWREDKIYQITGKIDPEIPVAVPEFGKPVTLDVRSRSACLARSPLLSGALAQRNAPWNPSYKALYSSFATVIPFFHNSYSLRSISSFHTIPYPPFSTLKFLNFSNKSF